MKIRRDSRCEWAVASNLQGILSRPRKKGGWKAALLNRPVSMRSCLRPDRSAGFAEGIARHGFITPSENIGDDRVKRVPKRRRVQSGVSQTARGKLETRRPGRHAPLAVRHQHDFAEHAAFAQHLVRAARLLEWQPLCDQWLDLALFEQIQQR